MKCEAHLYGIIPTTVVVQVVLSQSVVSDSGISWTVDHKAPLSMGFSRQEYWSELPFSSSGDIPNPGIKPTFPALQVDFLLSEPPRKSPLFRYYKNSIVIREETEAH